MLDNFRPLVKEDLRQFSIGEAIVHVVVEYVYKIAIAAEEVREQEFRRS